MTLPVVLVPEAEANILDAARWWARHRSADQAQRWYVGILDAIESLGEHPHQCPLARENNKFPYELRELPYGLGPKPTHRVVFTIRPDMVVVLAIRHGAQRNLEPDDVIQPD